MQRNFQFDKRVLDAMAIKGIDGKLADASLIYKVENRGTFRSYAEFTSYVMELEQLGYVKLTTGGRVRVVGGRFVLMTK